MEKSSTKQGVTRRHTAKSVTNCCYIKTEKWGYHGGYSWIKESIEGFKQLAKKYGYANVKSIWEYIEFYRNMDVLYSKFRDVPKCIPYAKARKVLRELKQKEKGKLEGNSWR